MSLLDILRKTPREKSEVVKVEKPKLLAPPSRVKFLTIDEAAKEYPRFFKHHGIVVAYSKYRKIMLRKYRISVEQQPAFDCPDIPVYPEPPMVPDVVTKSIDELDKPHEVRSLLKVFLSRNPHYKFIRTHRSNLSLHILQYILFDSNRKIKVAMTESELSEKLTLRK